LAVASLVLLWSPASPTYGQETIAPNQWEDAIRTFEEQDRRSPPPKNAILFVGSSSIRMWDLLRYFPGLEVINRGFGGSHISDSVEFSSRIVIPYEPEVVVLYAGDNDINAGKSPETVLRDFEAFVKSVHSKLPDTTIVFISIKPSIQRWHLVEKMREANKFIRTFIEKDERLRYVDVDAPMLGADKKPRPELFVADGLHLSAAGYELWASLVLPHLEALGSRKPGPSGESAKVLVNHVGFVPKAAKLCVMPGEKEDDFEVVNEETGRVACTGRLVPQKGDLGRFLVGDFSQLQKPGAYYVRTANGRSHRFRVSPQAYDDSLQKIVRYFSIQRCGQSTTGHNAPCHLDDGKRLDNGERQDVTGGWHDACDLRKWVDATIYGMIGLGRLFEVG